MAVTIRVRTGTAAAWTTANTILASGEIGFESDTYKIKIGDGSQNWATRAYYTSAVESHTHAAGDVTSGSFADARIPSTNVTQHQALLAIAATQITGTLATAQVTDASITNIKLADMIQGRIKGRAAAAGTGLPSDLTAAEVKTILALAASESSYSNATSGLTAVNVQAALDEIDAAVDVLSGGAGPITTLDYAGAASANFPAGASSGYRYIVTAAHANGTLLGTTNQITVDTNDILLAVGASPSTTDGAGWHKIDTTDKVVSVAGKLGAVVLAAGDIASGTLADARIATTNVTQHQAALSIATSQLSGTLLTARFAVDTVPVSSIQYVSGPHFLGREAGTLGAASALSMATAATMVQSSLSIAGSQLTGTVDGGTP